MTPDAKIGLLLGLVFIFIIAFVINGLPSFCEDRNNNELTTTMVGLQNNPPGLAARERKAQEAIEQIKPVKKQLLDEVQSHSAGKQDIRFTTPLPKSTSAVKKTVEVELVASAQPLSVVRKKERRKVKPSEPTLPKIYVIGEGDNLTVIAKKFYGAEEGNKEINIAKIFEANTELLESPDEIYVGQKLIIPPLSASVSNKSKISNILSNPMLKRVESIGKRHLSADGRKAEQGRQHIVQEGDSLWRIAAERLGDGNRYNEIARLNADILDDKDSLSVGMRLKIPVR